ncbi:uncharacterized protein An01g13420 [Aspergillus niger]|uniref:Contig An01c0400, genomic contig n=2 Tax=Aspergillus niger TaxID=5061 RepID=A2QB03_ASPNC|nr:uncharacterized protein An01g13420 [Aspergillus niger]CAK96211.1 unnamed protein product [Aspergillus niger]
MGRGFFALANHRAVFSVFRPKLASLVRLQLRHRFAVELDHGCCLVRPCGSANRLCPEAGFRVDRQNDAELLAWYGWYKVTVRQPTTLLETIELYGPRANAPPTTNPRTPSASVKRIKNSKNDPLQHPIMPVKAPSTRGVWWERKVESHSALTTLRAPSMDGEWGGGKGKDRLTAELEDEDCQPSPAKTRCQSCPEQPDPSGIQKDTATVDLGILPTSQRSDPLLRTTSSTVNNLERKRRAQQRELVTGEGCGAVETYTMTGRCSAVETFASRDNDFSRWTVGTGPSIVIVIPLVLPL